MKYVRQAIAQYFRRADLLLLLMALLIAGFGLVIISGAMRSLDTHDRHVTAQAVGIALGAAGFVLVSLLDLRRFPKLWMALFVANVLFQLSLHFFGVAGDTGNKSWIPLFSGLNIQPGEVGKILFIYTLASHMQQLREKLNRPLSLILLAAHMGITTLAVFAISRDMGVAIAYPVIFLVMLFAGGVSMAWMLAGVAVMGLMAWPLWLFMGEVQQYRILVVFDPELSPQFAWHAKQSMAALRRGGLSGAGLGQGRYFVNNHNDFIFASLCEQLGFVGGVALIAALTLLVFRILYGAARAGDLFGRALCAGVGGMLMFQILINIGMCMGIMPVIGITLPLVSAGGTSVMTTIAALGLVSGVRMRRKSPRRRNSESL